jgi:hypothetical protein
VGITKAGKGVLSGREPTPRKESIPLERAQHVLGPGRDWEGEKARA